MRLAVIVGLSVAVVSAPAVLGGEGRGERTLLIVLDAVPYETVARLAAPGADGREALFADFAPPVPLISTFPSSTSIALAGILGDHGLDISPGYEPRFFDWEAGRRRGGGVVSYFRLTFPWREFFDWNRKGPLRNALHAARPVRAGIRELEQALAAFEASADDNFSIYVADTDTAAHLFGPGGPEPILRALDFSLRALRQRVDFELRVVLLSDHGLAGGEPLRNVLPEVRARIEERGWSLDNRLEDDNDVVLTPYGLVSSFEAYAAPELAPALSRALAGVEGVDLCVWQDPRGWHVDAAHYTVEFARRSKTDRTEWSWSSRGGMEDGLVAELAGVVPGGVWVSDAKLLGATLGADYPDPLYRLAAAFEKVENPATVICSLENGFMYGAQLTERSARWTKGALRWTHGSLHRQASLGFLMTDDRSRVGQEALRYDQALVQPTRRSARMTPP